MKEFSPEDYKKAGERMEDALFEADADRMEAMIEDAKKEFDAVVESLGSAKTKEELAQKVAVLLKMEETRNLLVDLKTRYKPSDFRGKKGLEGLPEAMHTEVNKLRAMLNLGPLRVDQIGPQNTTDDMTIYASELLERQKESD